jgi:hypothetical protein
VTSPPEVVPVCLVQTAAKVWTTRGKPEQQVQTLPLETVEEEPTESMVETEQMAQSVAMVAQPDLCS